LNQLNLALAFGLRKGYRGMAFRRTFLPGGRTVLAHRHRAGGTPAATKEILATVAKGFARPHPGLLPRPERFNWVGRACMIFLRRDFVVRHLQIHDGYARASRLVLHKKLRRNRFPAN